MKKRVVSACFFWMMPAFLFFACKKSGAGSNSAPIPPSHSDLIGKWTIFKYIAANFDSSSGRPYIANDTFTPVHTETETFTPDSVYTDNWETDSYLGYVGGTFSNTQNTEFRDTSAYIANSSYIVEPRFALDDTTYIVGLSDTLLVTKLNIYIGIGPSSGVLYNIFAYARKQ